MTVTVHLEPLGRRHLDGLLALVADPQVRRFTRLPVSPPPDYAESWLRRYEERRLAGTQAAFAVVDGADGTFLGVAIAAHIDAPARTVELGYMVHPAARGRGVGVMALAQLTDWAFTALGALRLELQISAGNEASKKVAARCGYVFEGTLRSKHVKDDLRDDTEIWSRLPTDP